MATRIAHQKIVSALPATLDADTVYFVRVGAGFDQYVTNSTGTVVAYRANAAGTAGQVQYNSGGLPAGAAKVLIATDDNMQLVATNAGSDLLRPVTPALDALTVGAIEEANRKIYPVWVDPDGAVIKAQELIHESNYYHAGSAQSGQVFTYFNCAFTVAGATGRSVIYDSVNPVKAKPRMGLATNILIGNVASMYMASAKRLYLKTDTVNERGQPAGFTEIFRFCVDNPNAVARCFVGLATSFSAPTNVEPSTLLNHIGLIKRGSDTNWHFYAAGASAGTPLNLGAEFAYNDGFTTPEIELILHNPRCKPEIYWQATVTRAGIKAVAKGVVTLAANLPATAAFLASRAWVSNNTAAAVTDLGMVCISGSRPA